MSTLQQCKEQAVWIAHSLFQRGKVSGSTANMSFRHDGVIWITRSGSCFGTLCEEDFVPSGNPEDQASASKEWPLHHALYQRHQSCGAVIHTHSTYATAWSCLNHPDGDNLIPAYTPYLGMKLGKVVSVPYGPPGSRELFGLFEQSLTDAWGYLLSNHGPVVAGKTLMEAFYSLEELEESARLAWMLQNLDANMLENSAST